MNFYDSDAAVAQYLLFHYGRPEQICPLLPEARSACGFPVRCVSETLPLLPLPARRRALELGCAVGRSSLELSRSFTEVIGLDFSGPFIAAAKEMQTHRSQRVRVAREGELSDEMVLDGPQDVPAKNVRFLQGDACALDPELGTFDLILMANLLDRLPRPRLCLESLASFLVSGGGLILTSPYTWLTEYTPREEWLHHAEGTFAALEEILLPHFRLHHRLELPFLIREHRRKYQWSIAETSLWLRRDG